MFGISRTIKCGAAILAAAIMLVTFALPSYADSGDGPFSDNKSWLHCRRRRRYGDIGISR